MSKLFRARGEFQVYFYYDPTTEGPLEEVGKEWLLSNAEDCNEDTFRLIELTEVTDGSNVPQEDYDILPEGHNHANPDIGTYTVEDFIRNTKTPTQA